MVAIEGNMHRPMAQDSCYPASQDAGIIPCAHQGRVSQPSSTMSPTSNLARLCKPKPFNDMQPTK